MGVLSLRACGPEEVAAAASVPISRVRGHLERLEQAGLVRLDPESRVYSLDEGVLREWSASLLRSRAPRRAEAEEPLSRFLRADGTIVRLPARRARLQALLERVVEDFRPGVRYPEREVNLILGRRHPDFAALRRWLVDLELMQRSGGMYWRTGSVPFSGGGPAAG